MPQLSIMIKPASSLCNMRCKYCFYHSLASEREEFSFGKMTQSTTENLVEKALRFANGESVYFAFQGGEPLLAGKDYFANFVALVNKYNEKKSEIFFSLQTNGTLVDDEWTKFFLDNDFLIGLSLDGNQDANRFRLDGEFAPAFNKTFATAKALQKSGVKTNILIVATGWTADHIEEVYRFLRDEGFGYLQFIPCLRPFGDTTEGQLYMTVEQYRSFLVRLCNLYVKDFVRGKYVSVRYMDNLVRLFLGQKAEQCGLEGHCTHQFVVEGNGNVYPCDFYCLDKWLLGNVNESDFALLAHTPLAIEFIRESFDIPDKCKTCKYLALCRAGGCKRSRADRDYCEAYKGFFSACLPLLSVFKKLD
ncbi:MAG: radical SAM protein [Clostridia bacterium]